MAFGKKKGGKGGGYKKKVTKLVNTNEKET